MDKDRNQNYVNFVHLNLCIALAIGLLIFMAGIQGGAGSTVSFILSAGMAIMQCGELCHAILVSSHAITTREHTVCMCLPVLSMYSLPYDMLCT